MNNQSTINFFSKKANTVHTLLSYIGMKGKLKEYRHATLKTGARFKKITDAGLAAFVQ